MNIISNIMKYHCGICFFGGIHMNIRVFLCMLAVFVSPAIPQERPEWDNVSVFKVNAEAPHASMMIYSSRELALEG